MSEQNTTETQVTIVEGQNLPAAPAKAQLPMITGANYPEIMVAAVMQDFLEINEGLDLDFVRMGDYIRIDKKGKFYDSSDETNVFGDTLDVVIIQGEQRYTLWGDEKSPYKGQLIATDRDEAKARAAVDMFLMDHPDASEWHSVDDIELRYIAWAVPVSTIAPDVPPQVYLLSLPSTATIAFGKYAMAITMGKYKALGVPPRSTAKHVVTRLSTEDAKSKRDSSISYLAIKFQCLGMFEPKDFGIDIDKINRELHPEMEADEQAAGEADAAAADKA